MSEGRFAALIRETKELREVIEKYDAGHQAFPWGVVRSSLSSFYQNLDEIPAMQARITELEEMRDQIQVALARNDVFAAQSFAWADMERNAHYDEMDYLDGNEDYF